MLAEEVNERLARVGPGTDAGTFLRSYWLPVALPEQLAERNPMPVTVLGEKLVLFRTPSGELGLIADRCAHRGTSLSRGSDVVKTVGRIEDRGIRCCYHGWLYAPSGACVQQPGEPADSTFASKIRLRSAGVVERYGLIWAHLGENAPPQIPPVDAIARNDGYRVTTIANWACNYFQVCENLVDPSHVNVLHVETPFEQEKFAAWPRLRTEPSPLGMRMVSSRPGYERHSEYVMPTALRLAVPVGDFAVDLAFYVVPVDDETTVSFHAWFIPFNDEMPASERIRRSDMLHAFLFEFGGDSDRFHHRSRVNKQDEFAVTSQGTIVDRSIEHLATTDVGVIHLRQLFGQGFEAIRDGLPLPGAPAAPFPDVVFFPNVN